MQGSNNKVAKAGHVFVCFACGKRSRDRYGLQALSRGWDVSCTANAFLCYEDGLVLEGERVVGATPVREEGETDDPFEED